MRCTSCEFDYPEDLLSPFYDSSLDTSPLVCGPCALAKMNAVHGDNRTRFNGPEAEKMRLKAIKYRKENEVVQ